MRALPRSQIRSDLDRNEFYQIYAFYNNTNEISSEKERVDFYRPYLDLPTQEETDQAKAYWAKATELSRDLEDYIEKLNSAKRAPGDPPAYKDQGLRDRVAALRRFMKPLGIDGAPEFHWAKPWVTRTLIMKDLPTPRETYVQVGGDFLQERGTVYPGVPAVLSPKKVTGNRLDLAKWLVDPTNPLTARVTVNRMWQSYFGKGIVESQDDFG